MVHMEKDLQVLISKGKAQGYLTYDEVNSYLPNEDIHPEKVDNLLAALDFGDFGARGGGRNLGGVLEFWV